MQPEDRERLLWQVSETAGLEPAGDAGDAVDAGDTGDAGDAVDAVAEGFSEALSDDVLRAFRRGELGADDEARVTRRLARDPATRRRLLALAELDPPAAPAHVLEQLLVRRGTRIRPRRARVAALLVAALVALLIGWRLLLPTPDLPTHTVTIAALATHRDGPRADTAAGTAADAYANTPVTIDATVVARAHAGVEVALYRWSDGKLVRVALGDGVVRSERRGAVRWRGPAHLLVGSAPGRHSIFVVIARQGDLPSTVALPRGEDAITVLAAGGRRRVHRLPLRLLPPVTGLPAVGNHAEDEHGAT